MVNVDFIYIVGSSGWLEGKAKTHRPPAESEALHGNQQRWPKPSILSHLFLF